MTKKFFKYDYNKVDQGDFKLVQFFAPAKELWNLLAINRKVEDKDEGYQRTLSTSRVRSIAKYIDAGNPIPVSILITLDAGNYKLEGSKLKISNKSDVGWVIDGQHRLAGANQAKKDILLPVIAFLDLSMQDQIQQFIKINKEAKGVPTSLYFDLLKHLPDKTPSEYAKERAADIAYQLKKEETSPFYGKIVTVTAPKKGELSLNFFVKKLYPIIQDNKGLLGDYSIVEQEKIFNNFYSGLRNVFSKEFKNENSVFFQTIGFGSLLRIFPTFFSLCIKNNQGFDVNDVTNTFKKVSYFDFDLWRKLGTGNAAEIQAAEDFKVELQDAFNDDNDQITSIRL